ncbi:MAG TPA: 23S rRNA (uracil(1939)-C(5))-methyltransferase RlmD [Eubacteriaceae bacterium]|nr:23S rRNA (uracil(1939)-C(5))-methyltransferase RlmD [Eubacteriaceae bacterium]
MKRDIPVVNNEKYNIQIKGLGSGGEGVGKIEGFTIFVDGALPEEYIEAGITNVKANYAIGKLESIIQPSPYRISPPCTIAHKCGGCQIQRMDYQKQLEYKTQLVKDSIERIGKIKDVIIHQTIGMNTPFNYRNKAQFPIGMEDGKAALGFYAKRSHRIVPQHNCLIQHPVNTKISSIVKAYIDKYNLSIYDEEKHKGLLRHLVTRVGFITGEIMVILVANGESIPNIDNLVKRLTYEIPEIVSIYLNINKEKTNVILGRENKLIYGKKDIEDYIGDIKFKISPLSFYQVNPIQTKILYEKALEYADLKGDEVVYDAYCGIGTISLFLAQRAKKVIGIEILQEAIKDAKENARINKINNVDFYVGKTEEIIPQLYKNGERADVVVVDPPRKGCDRKLLDTIIQMKPKRVVYVSCKPSTLARDLNYLEKGGFTVKEIQPVDLFPHTGHVECVVLITRNM